MYPAIKSLLMNPSENGFSYIKLMSLLSESYAKLHPETFRLLDSSYDLPLIIDR